MKNTIATTLWRVLQRKNQPSLSVLLLVILCFSFGMAPGAQAATFTVNSTDDEVDILPTDGICLTLSGACTLRAAIQTSNATSGADVISVPAGTYTLTIPGNTEDAGATGDLDITNTVTINGAAATTTIIQAGTNNTNGIDKVFSVNQQAGSASATFNGVTIRFGRNTSPFPGVNAGYIGGGIYFLGRGSTCLPKLTVMNSVITDNSTTSTAGFGGGLAAERGSVEITNSTISNNKTAEGFGGGITHITISGCTFTVTNSIVSSNEAHGAGGFGEGGGIYFNTIGDGTVTIHNSVISGNASESRGGGIKLESEGTLTATIDQGTLIAGNTSLGIGGGVSEGGGLYINTAGSSTSTLQNVTITNNQASNATDPGTGGGIFINAGVLNVSLSRITGNAAPGGSTGIHAAAGTVVAENNWWGCDDFPGAGGCDDVVGTVDFDPRLDLNVAAEPTTVLGGGTSEVVANVFTNSNGQTVAPVVLNGLSVNFSATNGTMNGTSGTITAFTAESTYENTSCPPSGTDTVTASLDHGEQTVPLTITCTPDLGITKSDSPDPVTAGGNLTYTVSFTNNGPGSASDVTVTDAVPANTVFVSASAPAGWTITTPPVNGTGNVIFSKATVIDAETATFQIVVSVSPSATGTITNNATAATTSNDPNTANNTGTATTTVNAIDSDLGVTKSDSPDPVNAGSNLTYAINLSSNGVTFGSTGAVVTDAVPANTTFVSASAPPDWTVTAPAPGGTGNVTFTKSIVNPGDTAAFQMVVNVNASTANNATITNTVNVVSASSDANSANDMATTTTTVVNNAPPPLTCNGLTPTIVGNNSNNTINGTQGRDIIHGQGGNDTINGLGGNDVICGGLGNDRLNGQQGTDFCDGGAGNDTVTTCEQTVGVP